MSLESAYIIAHRAHAGQTDKQGRPYIDHPDRVAYALRPNEGDMVAALLHDVIEDSDYTLDRLRAAGIPEEIVTAIDHLTRRDGETYFDFIRRCKQNPMAARVKCADIADNTDPNRPPIPGMERRYAKALAILNKEDR